MPGMKTLTGMTGTGSAVELAEMLRQLGRGRDTVLAHITPEEAQMLMDRGGSGTINPNTGLPEFLIDFPDQDTQYEYLQSQDMPTVDVTGGGTSVDAGPSVDMTGFRQPTGFEQAAEPQEMPPGMRFDINVPSATQRLDITSPIYREPFVPFERTALPETPPEPGLAQRAESGLQQVRELTAKYPRLTQALGAGAQGIAALVQARRARQQGREQAARFAELGRPLREEAENLRQQALSGTLTPQQAAQQEAIRARMRQAAASRGVTTGTQAAMIENQLSRARAELSQTNLNNALRQLNLANAYDEAAIKASLAADREADELLGEIFTNIARDLSGARATTPQTSRMTTAQLPTQEVTRRPEIPRG